MPDCALGPEEQLLEEEQMKLVRQMPSELSGLQCGCVDPRLEGFRYREIAELLSVSTATVSSSLRNAVARLAKRENALWCPRSGFGSQRVGTWEM